MIHLPDLIQDLGFILITAAIVTLIFKKLGQPVVLGYLIAGFLLGPHVPFMPNVQDTNSVKVWAEIGVIILLFGLGLEFSFKKLARVGKSASITAVFEVAFMLSIGFIAGKVVGWSSMDSLFLGGILSISSTTIIVRAFDELGLKGKQFVALVFGVLVVEDIVAILLLVLLSTMAISKTLSGTELVFSSFRLGFFLVLWFVVGIYLLPLLLQKIRKLLNDETTLVVSLGLCLLMVMIATKVGFSPALGAFVMGSLLAETKEGTRIEHLVTPVRDLFSAVFFVSIGMLIDPRILIDYAPQVLFITILTIVGKLVSTTIGALVSGSSLRHSVQAGMSLAQIGEFSFIIATLGVSLKVTSDFLYPIAVAVSAITTFTTPYLIRSSDTFYQWLEKRLPEPFLKGLERYQKAVQGEDRSMIVTKLLFQAYGLRILLNTILVIAVFLFSKNLLLPFLKQLFEDSTWINLALAISAAVLTVPFFWAISFGAPSIKLNEQNRVRVERLSLGVQVARSAYALLLGAASVNILISINSLTGMAIFTGLFVSVIAGRFSEKIYGRLEKRFMKNLENNIESIDLKSQVPTLAPWDSGLADFVVNPNSQLVGMSLQQSRLKENFGVTVALVQRGEESVSAPDRNWILMPHDRVYIIGSEDQLLSAKIALENPRADVTSSETLQSFGLLPIQLLENSYYAGKIIRDSGLREAISGLIVGIERAGQRILSPDSALTLAPGDLLWVVGDIEKIKNIRGK